MVNCGVKNVSPLRILAQYPLFTNLFLGFETPLQLWKAIVHLCTCVSFSVRMCVKVCLFTLYVCNIDHELKCTCVYFLTFVYVEFMCMFLFVLVCYTYIVCIFKHIFYVYVYFLCVCVVLCVYIVQGLLKFCEFVNMYVYVCYVCVAVDLLYLACQLHLLFTEVIWTKIQTIQAKISTISVIWTNIQKPKFWI